MKKLLVAFDIDGTLINNSILEKDDAPNIEMVQLLILMARMKNVKILVWSGGGELYAARWVMRLGLNKYVWKACCKCPDYQPDIAFDDQHDFAMADKNVIVRMK